jgi:hypothetical protein
MFSSPRRQPVSYRLERGESPGVGRLDAIAYVRTKRGLILAQDRFGDHRHSHIDVLPEIALNVIASPPFSRSLPHHLLKYMPSALPIGSRGGGARRTCAHVKTTAATMTKPSK